MSSTARTVAAILGMALVAVAADDKTIVVDGSTTVGPLAKAFAEYLMQQNPGLNITVSESGSGNGAKSLVNGACNVATMSRKMKAEEQTAAINKNIKPVARTIAYDGIAVIVHPGNPVTNVTLKQLKDIYMGKIASWRDLGGPDTPIVVISRDTNSGTYECFVEKVLKMEKMSEKAEYVGSNGAVRDRVQNTAGAIGYVGLAFVDKSVKAVTVDGIAVNEETVAKMKYPIGRPLFFYTNGEPDTGTNLRMFADFHTTQKGKDIIKQVGFVVVPEKATK